MKVYIAGKITGNPSYKDEFRAARDAQPAEKVVAVDGELGLILNFAVRYACGRMTYAPMAVINFITPLIPHLDDRTLALLDKDLQDAQYNGGYGDPKVDEPRWKEFHALVRQERRRRVGIANLQKEGE